MGFFESYLLLSCSVNIGQRKEQDSWIMTNCYHYDDYRDEERFLEIVKHNRQSYMACLAYKHNRKRIKHVSVPVIMGTYVDYLIRGEEAVKRSRAQWGQVVLQGIPKIYMSFSTFDALSMHVRETKNQRSIEWYFYIDDDGVGLSYRDHVITITYKRETVTSADDAQLWIRLINAANPFGTRSESNDYVDMFDVILSYPYDMNDLKNRKFLNCGTVINKSIEMLLKKNASGNVKMSEYFEIGNLYTALSKKSAYDHDESSKSYSQSFDSTLHDGRSNKISHYLSTVVRGSNEAFRNSSALVYPNDAFNYLCTVNTKDLKSAGEQNVLADFVMMTEDSDANLVYRYLQSISKSDGRNILILDGFLINCRCDWTFDVFLAMKRHRDCVNVTTKYYEPYIYCHTKSSIPIKYSAEHDVYFSPAETTKYGITYEPAAQFSTTVKILDPWALVKNPPAKTTVAINNIKGSVANVTSAFHKQLISSSLGITCYVEIDDDLRIRILDSAVTGHGLIPYADHFAEIDRVFDNEPPRVEDTDAEKALRSLLRMFDLRKLQYTCEPTKTETYVYNNAPHLRRNVIKYVQTIMNRDAYEPPNPWNLTAWVAFGNVRGACVEDSVVFDKKFVEHVPPVHYNACISVEFTFKNAKTARDARFIDVHANTCTDDTLIGCVVTNTEVYTKHSRHCNILVTVIGNHYYHLIHFKPKNQYDRLEVDSVKSNKTLTVLIRGQHLGKFGVGTKIANSFGQKNVCGAVEDLSGFWGITRDGRRVHAQIVFSDVSLIGRVPAGQIRSMLAHPDCAIGPNKEIIAPQNIVIHAMHPYTNLKIFDIRADTLVNVNGFDSQALSSTTLALRTVPVLPEVRRVIGMHGFRLIDATTSENEQHCQ
ncbi:uncharacterized protein LOC112603114 [Melanaphis sacchari]|uniref:uncharacterized protein LOC112603114 n=1 Tax=Melanaphis sacchari TaxID=742174 RepID=UPI000DC13939|nr:uncharacterized protein LOC112603114 [Melanaphis sacchari]